MQKFYLARTDTYVRVPNKVYTLGQLKKFAQRWLQGRVRGIWTITTQKPKQQTNGEICNTERRKP